MTLANWRVRPIHFGRVARAAGTAVATALAAIGLTYLWSLAFAIAYWTLGHQSKILRGLTLGGDVLLPIEFAWRNAGDPEIARDAKVAAGAVALLVVAALAAWMTRRPVARPKGGATLAALGDLRRSRLLQNADGHALILGRFAGRTVAYAGDSHVFINGPTRSGKGVSFAQLNAQIWRGSLIALDIKHELFDLVGPARLALGQRCFMFSPGSERSHCWNPLDFIRPWPARATDLGNIAVSLLETPKNADSYWVETARDLFAACVGYVLESARFEGRRTLRSVLRLFSTGRDFAKVLTAILEQEPNLHPFIADKFRRHIGRHHEQRPSFESHITTSLMVWDNPLVAAVTSRSDFPLEALRRKPFSVFIGTPAGDLRTVEPVVRLFVQQIHDVLLRKLPGQEERAKVLLLLDEFYQFGRLPEIVDAAPLVAGYGFKIAFMVQNVSQLDVLYGREIRRMILGNTDVKLFVGVGDEVTAQTVSKAVGMHYVEREGWSASQGAGRMGWRSSKQGRWELAPLMSEAEVAQLAPTKSIVFLRGAPALIVDKIYATADAGFAKRSASADHLRAKLDMPQLRLTPETPLFAHLVPAGEEGMRREGEGPFTDAGGDGAQFASPQPPIPSRQGESGVPQDASPAAMYRDDVLTLLTDLEALQSDGAGAGLKAASGRVGALVRALEED